MKKLLVLLLILAVAGGLFAQEAGTWSVSGWVRSGTTLDFEGEDVKSGGIPDFDPTGAAATLKYSKGNWTVAGTAEATITAYDEAFDALSGNVEAKWANDGWEVINKVSQGYNPADSLTYEFSASKWNQTDDTFGIKGQITLNGDVGDAVFTPSFILKEYNKVALFQKFWDGKILLESGIGDYVDNNQWGSPGPLEPQYERVNDKDSLIRVQFKVVDNLNFGFSYNTGVNLFHNPLPAYAEEPGDFLRSVTLGAKYAGGPLTLAAGLNLIEDAEKFYAGIAYTLLGSLTLSFDGEGTNLGVFGDEGTVRLGEKIVYSADPLEVGLTLKETNLVHNTLGESAGDLLLSAEPWVNYVIKDKIAKVQLKLGFEKGLGENNDKATTWWIRPMFFYSLKGDVTTALNDYTGLCLGYKYGVASDITEVETTTNELYVGFRVAF
jgi:hypothetical protein